MSIKHNNSSKIVVMLVIFTIIALIWAIRFFTNKEKEIIFNEKIIVLVLKQIFNMQTSFHQTSHVDQNKNGRGEFGLLKELISANSLRNPEYPVSGMPGYLPMSFMVPNSHNYATVHKYGYHFQIFLPHINQPITDNRGDKNISEDLTSIKAQETQYIVYAWPIKADDTRSRCFVLWGNDLKIFASTNRHKDRTFYYSGIKTPNYDSAMPADRKDISSLKWAVPEDGKIAKDGQIWNICDIPIE